jgi:hypothetical protein
MRHVLFLVLGLVLGGLGVHAVAARADGEGAPAPAPAADPVDPGSRLDALFARYERETAALKTEIDYLASREATLSKYILSLAAAATNVRTNVALARTQGFEMAAIPYPSRITVLKSLDQLAGDLSGALPAPTPNEVALRRKAEELKRAAGWK